MSLAQELLKLTSDIALATGRKAEIVVTMPEDQLSVAAHSIAESAARSIAESCFIADTIATGRTHIAFWADDPWAGDPRNGFDYLGVKFEPRRAQPPEWPGSFFGSG